VEYRERKRLRLCDACNRIVPKNKLSFEQFDLRYYGPADPASATVRKIAYADYIDSDLPFAEYQRQ
jgi:hypothetical protein